MLDYDYFSEYVGRRYNIVNGDIVRATDGVLMASDVPGPDVVYVDRVNRIVTIMADYIGNPYVLQETDCVSLALQWRANNGYNDNTAIYRKMPLPELIEYYSANQTYRAFEDYGMVRYDASEASAGDVVMYKYDTRNMNHVGIITPDDSILHHLPSKLSSIDPVNLDYVWAVYRDE